MAALNVAPGAARRAVHDFCLYIGLAEDRIHDIVLCVSEAVTNVVLHAYGDAAAEGVVEIDAHVDEHLCFHVRDTGGGLRPRPDNPGVGLGLPIISQLAHSLELRTHERGGTEVVMKFRPAVTFRPCAWRGWRWSSQWGSRRRRTRRWSPAPTATCSRPSATGGCA